MTDRPTAKVNKGRKFKTAQKLPERTPIARDVLWLNMQHNVGNVNKKFQLYILNISPENHVSTNSYHTDRHIDRWTNRRDGLTDILMVI